MAAAVNPNRDPFRGGSFTGTSVPNVNGSINPANVSGSLMGGVSPGEPMLARNDRGSNISIPYARVVFHPSERTALVAVEGTMPTPDHTTLGKPGGDQMVETEVLHSGRLAFVLGRRGSNYDGGVNQIVGFDTMEMMGNGTVNSRNAGFLAQFAVGGSDINTAQRLCSFEYLERYFHHVLRKKVIEIKDESIFEGSTAPLKKQNAIKAGYGAYHLVPADQFEDAKMTSILTYRLLDAVQTSYKGGADSDPDYKKLKVAIAKSRYSGLFLYDNGPFLRGKNLDHRLLQLRSKPHNKKVPVALGDDMAFDSLQRQIAAVGACDWTPDGIVLSRLSQGDRIMDDELDSRDGQLYNITIAGPAISSSWTGDYHKEVMPLDKVFMVIVADVWDGAGGKAAADTANGKAYTEYGNDKMNRARANARPNGRDAAAIKIKIEEINSSAAITNMRVRLTTSSEMINCSAMKAGKDNVDSKDPTSRMGLMISGDGGVSEYIIGGWCIGTVIDASASRAMPSGMNLMGSAKRAKSSISCNVAVNIKWWSADKMFRNYMNRDNKNRARYEGFKGLPQTYSRSAQWR